MANKERSRTQAAFERFYVVVPFHVVIAIAGIGKLARTHGTCVWLELEMNGIDVNAQMFGAFKPFCTLIACVIAWSLVVVDSVSNRYRN